MTGLVERLRDVIAEAADEIERLRAVIEKLTRDNHDATIHIEDRDMLIEEALAVEAPYSQRGGEDFAEAWHRVRTILSRAPQGAADRRGEAGDGPPTTDDPVPLGSYQRETPRQMMDRMESEVRAANPEPDHHEPFTMPNTRIGSTADQRDALLNGLRVAMLGTTDGDFLDPNDSSIPVGEMYRLAAEHVTALIASGVLGQVQP